MKMTNYFIIIIFLISHVSNKSKSTQSRFEIRFKECRKGYCNQRELDESCVLRCISKKCYNRIYENYILEFGEANYDKKSEFESCFNRS